MKYFILVNYIVIRAATKIKLFLTNNKTAESYICLMWRLST